VRNPRNGRRHVRAGDEPIVCRHGFDANDLPMRRATVFLGYAPATSEESDLSDTASAVGGRRLLCPRHWWEHIQWRVAQFDDVASGTKHSSASQRPSAAHDSCRRPPCLAAIGGRDLVLAGPSRTETHSRLFFSQGKVTPGIGPARAALFRRGTFVNAGRETRTRVPTAISTLD